MKTMTCRQLGGACDEKFRAETFDEIAQRSKQHGMKMFQQGDRAHLEVMDRMKKLMTDPQTMQNLMESKRQEFEALPED